MLVTTVRDIIVSHHVDAVVVELGFLLLRDDTRIKKKNKTNLLETLCSGID